MDGFYSSPKVEEYSTSHTLPDGIIFLGSKRSIIPSQTCLLQTQKNFQISQAPHGLNK